MLQRFDRARTLPHQVGCLGQTTLFGEAEQDDRLLLRAELAYSRPDIGHGLVRFRPLVRRGAICDEMGVVGKIEVTTESLPAVMVRQQVGGDPIQPRRETCDGARRIDPIPWQHSISRTNTSAIRSSAGSRSPKRRYR